MEKSSDKNITIHKCWLYNWATAEEEVVWVGVGSSEGEMLMEREVVGRKSKGGLCIFLGFKITYSNQEKYVN